MNSAKPNHEVTAKHVPVLLHQAVECLDLTSGEIFLDGTLGSAGHASRIAEKWGRGVTIIGLDQDPEAVKRSEAKLQTLNAKYFLKTQNFRRMDEALFKIGINAVDAILLDLGFSSDQLESSGRGFSFLRDEPLDMRMGETDVTAADILNSFPESTLELILRGFGEEKYSRQIAEKIVEARATKPFETTFDLVKVVEEATPHSYRKLRIHPATRTFQALRIAVNDELTALEEGLAKGFELLKPGGRFAVISFHSLEDRLVKNFFRERVRESRAELVFKKPITASSEEIRNNPRSRSAKLRAIKKL